MWITKQFLEKILKYLEIWRRKMIVISVLEKDFIERQRHKRLHVIVIKMPWLRYYFLRHCTVIDKKEDLFLISNGKMQFNKTLPKYSISTKYNITENTFLMWFCEVSFWLSTFHTLCFGDIIVNELGFYYCDPMLKTHLFLYFTVPKNFPVHWELLMLDSNNLILLIRT